MRLWLAGAFAAVSLITAAAVYLFGDNRRALIVAVPIGILAGFLIAVAISHRVARLARAAGEMAARLLRRAAADVGPGRDRRPRPRARLDARLAEGELRRAHRRPQQARGDLRRPHRRGDGRRRRWPGPLLQQRRRRLLDADRPAARGDAAPAAPRRRGRLRRPPGAADRRPRLRDDRPARCPTSAPSSPSLRDRTDELRREFAEADFVSNAAHELRNPLAGISGAIEVLQSGAKDDPQARDHFLDRLAEDAERMNRLTQSLLTLARVESRRRRRERGRRRADRDPRRRRRRSRRRRTSTWSSTSSPTSPPRATRPCCAR